MVMQQNKSSMFNVIKTKQKPLVRRQRRRNEDVQFGETLANKGIIQLWGEITAESIYPAATQMMEYNFMDEEDAPAQISLFIDSVGGDVFSTYHLIDLIKQDFNCSLKESEEYCEILYATTEGRENIKYICEKYGIDIKQITKLKLKV